MLLRSNGPAEVPRVILGFDVCTVELMCGSLVHDRIPDCLELLVATQSLVGKDGSSEHSARLVSASRSHRNIDVRMTVQKASKEATVRLFCGVKNINAADVLRGIPGSHIHQDSFLLFVSPPVSAKT